MRDNRLSGSEGGGTFIGSPYPYPGSRGEKCGLAEAGPWLFRRPTNQNGHRRVRRDLDFQES